VPQLSSKRSNSPIRILPSFIRAGILLTFLLLAASHTLSQEKMQGFRSSETDEKPAAVLTVNVNEVDLAFAVTDRHHRWITDLSED